MSKKQTSNEPIILDEALGKSEAFILKYKNHILALVAAIVIAIVGSVYYSSYTEEREAEAAEAMYQAEALFAENRFEEALNGDSVTILGFIEIADEYSGTKIANLAKAYAGFSLAKLDRYEEAISYLQDFDGNDQMVAASVLRTLGNCYANTGDNNKAVKYLVEAAEVANNNSISPNCLFIAARVYEVQGDKEEALKLYNQIKSEYPSSYEAMDIDKYIEHVK